ncbi:MAG TPA: hypothetical protein VIG30_11230 [Ktedonobacterales bacterium]
MALGQIGWLGGALAGWQMASGQPWLPVAVALALDLAGLGVAIWVTSTRHHMPGRVRWAVGAGLVVAAMAPLAVDALALARAQSGAANGFGDLDPLLRWVGGIVGMLVLAGGLGWATTRRASQRALAVLAVLGMLVVLAAGGIIAWLAAAGWLPARWTPDTSIPAFSVAQAGVALALLGAVGTVAAVALGRTAGAGSRAMRARLALAAFGYAVCVVGGPWLVAVLPLAANASASNAVAPAIVAALALAGLLALALTTRRLLTRTAAGSGVYMLPTHPAHARGHAAPAAGARPPARLAAAVPRGGAGAVPVVVGPAPWLIASVEPSTTPFTPPALRRSVFVERAERSESATAGYEAPHLIHLPQPPAPPVPPAAARPDAGATAAMPDAAPGGVPGGVPGAPTLPGHARRDLSPQFVASVVRLQAELARAGHDYTFEELLDAFAAVAPRTR